MSSMEIDYHLRQNSKYHNVGISQVFDAVYTNPIQPIHNPLPLQEQVYSLGTASPVLKPIPMETFPTTQKPYIDWNSYTNPEFRSKYNLPKKIKNAYFDPMVWTTQFTTHSKPMKPNPELPQAHLLFEN